MISKKKQLNLIIHTSQHKIVGQLHVIPNSRLSDILNAEGSNKNFIPITNAEVTDLRTKETTHPDFVLVNRKTIELVFEEISND